MGDVLTLIERAETSLDQEKAQRAGERLLTGEFDLEDFLEQISEIKKMGPMSQILEMMPGMPRVGRNLSPDMTDKQTQTGGGYHQFDDGHRSGGTRKC